MGMILWFFHSFGREQDSWHVFRTWAIKVNGEQKQIYAWGHTHYAGGIICYNKEYAALMRERMVFAYIDGKHWILNCGWVRLFCHKQLTERRRQVILSS